MMTDVNVNLKLSEPRATIAFIKIYDALREKYPEETTPPRMVLILSEAFIAGHDYGIERAKTVVTDCMESHRGLTSCGLL